MFKMFNNFEVFKTLSHGSNRYTIEFTISKELKLYRIFLFLYELQFFLGEIKRFVWSEKFCEIVFDNFTHYKSLFKGIDIISETSERLIIKIHYFSDYDINQLEKLNNTAKDSDSSLSNHRRSIRKNNEELICHYEIPRHYEEEKTPEEFAFILQFLGDIKYISSNELALSHNGIGLVDQFNSSYHDEFNGIYNTTIKEDDGWEDLTCIKFRKEGINVLLEYIDAYGGK